MSLPEHMGMQVIESSLPPGLPLPRYRELRVKHAPMVKAHGRLLLMIAAAYGGRNDGALSFKYREA